jgi:hypothetical protein
MQKPKVLDITIQASSCHHRHHRRLCILKTHSGITIIVEALIMVFLFIYHHIQRHRRRHRGHKSLKMIIRLEKLFFITEELF